LLIVVEESGDSFKTDELGSDNRLEGMGWVERRTVKKLMCISRFEEDFSMENACAIRIVFFVHVCE